MKTRTSKSFTIEKDGKEISLTEEEAIDLRNQLKTFLNEVDPKPYPPYSPLQTDPYEVFRKYGKKDGLTPDWWGPFIWGPNTTPQTVINSEEK